MIKVSMLIGNRPMNSIKSTKGPSQKNMAVIYTRNLSFTYPHSQKPVLKKLDLDIHKGEIFGLLGPSGCGKSTTQRILMGLLKGFSGTANVFSRPISDISRRFYEKIGVCFELPALYLRLSALENLSLFASLYSAPTLNPHHVLEMVGLRYAANQRVANFSKGMKMRLNLCRALIHDPQLLFLDEPTTGQDPSRARLTHELLMHLKEQGKTIFLTTHNMAEAEHICDRVGFLSNGKIPVAGPPNDLKIKYGKRQIEVITSGKAGVVSNRFPMENLGKNQKFLKTIKQSDIRSIHTLEASLEEVFIKVTSHVEHSEKPSEKGA